MPTVRYVRMGLLPPNGSRLKLRAASLSAPLAADEVLCPPGHKPSDSLKSDRTASFKRMLGRAISVRGGAALAVTIDTPSRSWRARLHAPADHRKTVGHGTVSVALTEGVTHDLYVLAQDKVLQNKLCGEALAVWLSVCARIVHNQKPATFFMD